MSRYWRGAHVDDRLADQLDEVARIVPVGTILRPTQGSWSGVAASGGTHVGCGAVDLAGEDKGMTQAMRDDIVAAMRQVGIAAWGRTPEQSDWPYHEHGISVQPGGKHDAGCLSSQAHSQVVDYYEGRNGLAGKGPDDGPRIWVGVTWEDYCASGSGKSEGDWFDMADKDDLKAAVREVLNEGTPKGQTGWAAAFRDYVYGGAHQLVKAVPKGQTSWGGAFTTMYDRTGDIINKLNTLQASVDKLDKHE